MSLTARQGVHTRGARGGTDVVRLSPRGARRSVPRPAAQLRGSLRVPLPAGESARVRFEVPPTRLAFTDPRYR
ncbi:fibronectin type III-like domain-contianing protein, partial [Clavibacter michiganensis]|uniref:fibronectin type III-like domain-contianing protein n=1 Tax=Clavibacter michiganensis TaxID=28447 RepID=UPI0029318388